MVPMGTTVGVEAWVAFKGYCMREKCKNCDVKLTLDNVSKATATKFRAVCKPCRSKAVVKYQQSIPERRRAYANKFARSSGRVKQYPCLTCSVLCYKIYAKAFCSPKCRFLSYVKKTDSCWLWIGAKNRRGYGKMCFEGNLHATTHRVSYQIFKGPITEDMFVCHSCDNPSCVNPDHLWLGTPQDNKTDQLEKGRGGFKLKSKDVLEIRRLHATSIRSVTIARLFDVSQSAISNIINRRVWKHI